MAPRLSPEQICVLLDRQAAGATAAVLAGEMGVTRNAVLGILHRHRQRHGLPALHPDRARRSPSWSDESALALMCRQAEGTPAAALGREFGVSKGTILGVIHRYRESHGLPDAHLLSTVSRAVVVPVKPPKPSTPPTPRPPAAARVPKPTALTLVIGIRTARPLIRLTPMIDKTPRCEAVQSDGSVCGRIALRDGKCMGHLYLADPSARLRPYVGRVTSKIRLIEIIESKIPREERKDVKGRVYLRMAGVAGMSPSQISSALCGSGFGASMFERLAAHYGWRKVTDDTYMSSLAGEHEAQTGRRAA